VAADDPVDVSATQVGHDGGEHGDHGAAKISVDARACRPVGRRFNRRSARPASLIADCAGHVDVAHGVVRRQTDFASQHYFYVPKSPWQRGANENTNHLLRQYLDKNGNIGVHDQPALDQIAAKLNDRPRCVLDWRTPAEV